jgi:DNA repair exonuclease SbcCD ATPase subunit
MPNTIRSLKTIEADLLRLESERDVAVATLANDRKSLKKERAAYITACESRDVLQAVAQKVQESAHKQIAAIVTRCLQCVFHDPYEFAIHFDRKRGKTEARITLTRNGEDTDPMTAAGGGVVDVASFGLRLACLTLRVPRCRKLLILDEPFKFVSAEFIPAVREMIEQLAEDLDFQIVMITHIEGLQIGDVVDVQ